MDRQDSWKRTQEAEIDLTDFLCRLLKQWKRIAVCAMICALLMGVYGWIKGRSGSDTDSSGAVQEDMPLEQEETEMTEAQVQAVEDAVLLSEEIQDLETYLEHSVLMQADPYHKARYIMLYCIDSAKRQELSRITESYLNFLLNGGVTEVLAESKNSWNMDKSYLAELIAAYQKVYASPYQVVADVSADHSLMTETLFYVEITGRNAAEAKRMALDVQEILKNYSDTVKENSGSHILELVSTAESIVADSSLQSQQHEKKAVLSSGKSNLRAVTETFNKEQMAAYQKAAGIQGEQEDKAEIMSEEQMPEENESGEHSGFKYMILGLAGGVFAYGLAFLCWYVWNDAVKSAEEMKKRYVFPVYGAVCLEDRDKKGCRRWMKARDDTYGCSILQMMNRIRLACQNQEITSLYAACDFKMSEPERECLDHVADELKGCGIDMTAVDCVSTDTAVWDGLAENGHVLLVCKTGITTHRMIDYAMNFYLQNGIAVMGVAVFLQI